MAEFHLKTSFTVGCLATLLVLPSAKAAEKVKFSSPGSSAAAVSTQPAPTLEGLIPEKVDNIGNVNVNVRPTSLPSANITTRGTGVTDDTQENWIFRDTQSAQGIQRALGVEVYESNPTNSGESDSTTVIQEYFSRRDQSATVQTAPRSGDPIDSLGLPAASSGRLSGSMDSIGEGMFSPGQTTQSRSSYGVNNSGFKSTLNSSNPSIRSYYRDLYKDQLRPNKPIIPELSKPSLSEQSSPQGARTRQLYERAAYIESVRPKGPVSVFDQQLGQNQVQEPAEEPDTQRFQAPTLERRGGKTVIPSRPF